MILWQYLVNFLILQYLCQNIDSIDILSDLAWFNNTLVFLSHIHMIQTLTMLEININNKSDNKPSNFKQAICHSNWSNCRKKAMQAEYDFIIINETWKLILIPENQQVIIDQRYFKLKNDCNSHIWKYKV